MTIASDAQSNGLLAALSEVDRERWLPRLEPVRMLQGQVLFESGVVPLYAYYPTTAIVSMMYIAMDGAQTETAVIGHEGMVGVGLLMGGGSTSGRAVVRGGGGGFRMNARAISEEFAHSADVSRLLLRHVQAQITQIAQTCVCNRHHTVNQQLCRCLLMTLDRSEVDSLDLTQEAISDVLGVRRESVTKAALVLRNMGLIEYGRGRIRILDRPGLERAACECYGVVKREYDRLLPARAAVPAPLALRTPLIQLGKQPAYRDAPVERRTCAIG